MKTKHIISIASAVAATAAICYYFFSRRQSKQNGMIAGNTRQGAKIIRQVMHHAKVEPGATT